MNRIYWNQYKIDANQAKCYALDCFFFLSCCFCLAASTFRLISLFFSYLHFKRVCVFYRKDFFCDILHSLPVCYVLDNQRSIIDILHALLVIKKFTYFSSKSRVPQRISRKCFESIRTRATQKRANEREVARENDEKMNKNGLKITIFRLLLLQLNDMAISFNQ